MAAAPKLVAVTVVRGTIVWGPASTYSGPGQEAYLTAEDAAVYIAEGLVKPVEKMVKAGPAAGDLKVD